MNRQSGKTSKGNVHAARSLFYRLRATRVLLFKEARRADIAKFISKPFFPSRIADCFNETLGPDRAGYKTTRRIRDLDVPKAKTIPPVAMTANVFREDMEM